MQQPSEGKAFGALLRDHRTNEGLTQARLAERAGLSRRGIADLERGARQAPYARTIELLAAALGLSDETRAHFEAAAKRASRTRPGAPELLFRRNIPGVLTSFVGREREIADVQARLRTTRLLTLVGTGGIGKTRLAIEVAADRAEAEPGAATFVDLAPLTDPRLVAPAVATGLGIRERPGHAVLEALVEALRSTHVLIVLDNCEHLVQACAQLAYELLAACPNLQILATSREVLALAGEVVWRVRSLEVPSTQCSPSKNELASNAAVRLFVDRATAVLDNFELSEDNASIIAEICCSLEGLPLAIELAAARVSVLSLGDIAGRLDDRLRLLTGGSRTALPRQQTLRGTLDWSYDLLSEAEQLLFNRLAVFAGGWTLEAAEAVCAGDGMEPDHVLDLIAQLVAKSMVVVQNRVGELRYRMPETIRQYAAEKLLALVDEPLLRRRHVEWFLLRAQRFEASFANPDQVAWLDQIEADLDNMRAALGWGKMEIGEREAALRLAAALRIFWWRRGHVLEGCQHLDELLKGSEQCGGGALVARARGFQTAGFLRIRQGAPVAARRYLEDALGLGRQLGDKRLIGTVLVPLGQAAFQEGNPDAARSLYEEALTLAGEVGGWMHWHILYMLLGEVAEAQGVPDQAAALYQQGLDFGRTHGDTHFTGLILHALGNFALTQGNLTAARAYLKESLLTLRGVAAGSDVEVAGVLSSVAGLAATSSAPAHALRLAGGVQALLRAQDAALRPTDQARLDRQLESARQALDDATARGAWVEGEDMSLEELVTYALGALEQQAPGEARGPLLSALPQAESHQQPFRLTPRELEVADLLAHGLTNRDIAGELVISAGTAEVHVKHILAKLGFTSRSQITAWAIRERTSDGPRPTIPTPRKVNT